ncbi:MAG: hypothetical protein KDK36_01945 [Leptospiraceae bacterium]|nr:hypothetical protein [Leptospiraceae bacterium]
MKKSVIYDMNKLSFSVLIFFLFNLFLFADAKKEDKVELIIPDSKKAEGSWGKEADEVEAIQDIKIIDDLSEESTIARMEEARTHFNTSLEIYKAAEKTIKDKKEVAGKESRPSDKYEWQKRARQMQLEREYNRISLEGRKNAVLELIKGMNAIDKIENPSTTASQIYIDLKASLYREYIKHQFRMKNYNQAMDLVLMYVKLGEQYEKESEPHKLLAICYEFNERQAAKYKRESLREEFRAKKNKHLLKYAELAYGKDSNQYKRIEKKVKYQPVVKLQNSTPEKKEESSAPASEEKSN